MKRLADSPPVLLVVDDERSVCRALTRMLSKRVEVVTALNPAEAETVLASRPVTHLICDHWFGPGNPLGFDLALKWRERCPTIERVVILTGTDTTRFDPHPAIDAVMDKTVEPEALMEALDL